MDGRLSRANGSGAAGVAMHTTFSTDVPILYHKPIVHDKAGLLRASECAMLAPHLRMACLRGLTR